jgi:hypothetical protein
MNQTPSTTAFDVTLADGSRERIDAEKVFVAESTHDQRSPGMRHHSDPSSSAMSPGPLRGATSPAPAAVRWRSFAHDGITRAGAAICTARVSWAS